MLSMRVLCIAVCICACAVHVQTVEFSTLAKPDGPSIFNTEEWVALPAHGTGGTEASGGAAAAAGAPAVVVTVGDKEPLPTAPMPPSNDAWLHPDTQIFVGMYTHILIYSYIQHTHTHTYIY
jgi:hypothetical protein